jgi:F-type H+-transporting ATPase subunit b
MTLTSLPLLLALAGGGGLTDPHMGLLVWTLVLFAIFAFVTTKLGWGPLLKMIEERERGVRDSVEGAQRANTEAQSLLTQHREMLRDAGREREEIIKRALSEAEQLKADLSARARAESDQIVSRAREQIEREKNTAVQQLRSEVAELAMAAAAKIVESSMTPDQQRKLVDQFITQLPQGKN